MIARTLLILSIATTAFAQNSENVKQVGRIYNQWGEAQDIVVVGDLAYVVEGESGLRVISIADPENPLELGYYDTPGEAHAVAVSENALVYVADQTNLGIYYYRPDGPALFVSPKSLDFGDAGVDSSSEMTATIHSWGREGLNLWEIYTESNCFSAEFDEPFVLEPDSSFNAVVMFAPDTIGVFSGDLHIATNDPQHEEFTIDLRGIGVAPDVVPEDNLIPDQFSLSVAYPNPFNSSTTISYSLPVRSQVALRLYDLMGRVVTELFAGSRSPGVHSTTLTADNLPSGLYIIRLQAASQVVTQKVMLIR